MKPDSSPSFVQIGHHSTGLVEGNRSGRGIHVLSDAGVRISLAIIVGLLLIFTISVQKTARSIARENALLVDQLKTAEGECIRLKTELARALSDPEKGG